MTALPGKGLPDAERCPERTTLDGDGHRLYRCQERRHHEGQCGYHRRGSQRGTTHRWWGANERPIGWLEDLNSPELRAEVHRLRALCDEAGVDWRSGLTCPHCGGRKIDRGATGLDLCETCGGLSRDGRTLAEAEVLATR